MDTMLENIYRYKINKINFKDATVAVPGRINVFVGANNCGKTQLLKDMLAYMTGSRTDPVLLNSLDLTYPATWEQFTTTYPMDIIEGNNGLQQIRHISPTLNEQPSGPQMYSLEDKINIRRKGLFN